MERRVVLAVDVAVLGARSEAAEAAEALGGRG
jgi:hypothetical protein